MNEAGPEEGPLTSRDDPLAKETAVARLGVESGRAALDLGTDAFTPVSPRPARKKGRGLK